MHEIVERLVTLIERHHWKNDFNEAIRIAQSHKVPSIKHIKDLNDYLNYINDLVTWAPKVSSADPRLVYLKIVEFYFFLDQPPVKRHQSPIAPGEKADELTPLSKWIVEFATSWGSYLDTTESAKEVKTFKNDPLFNWGEYMPPPASFLPEEDYKAYRTFNQFFARHVKPGMRPVACPHDDSVLVSPADCTFVGSWQISENSQITVDQEPPAIVMSKGIQWSIHELLRDSAYADRFKGGIFTHSFLNTYDYHRWHTPVQGKILEARIIQGQAYLNVDVNQVLVEGKPVNHLNALDNTGYQFVQSRGLIVIDSPIGLVACLPMGMAQVSSVVITAEVGVTLRKGEELGYFQFGGSDFVMVFERASNVQLIGQTNVHVQQGTWIGNAAPYSMK
ncbi:MAG: phosphatidylserine decarboxylase [Planctomycetes bacterium]|nr:phosphatidylserine decarboxylase [Planctomycetota bacterium]